MLIYISDKYPVCQEIPNTHTSTQKLAAPTDQNLSLPVAAVPQIRVFAVIY
jgi:hypothetical protein